MAKKNGIPQKYTVGMEFTHEQTATSKEILLLKAEVALDVKNVTYFTQVKGKGCRAEIVPESGSVKEGIL